MTEALTETEQDEMDQLEAESELTADGRLSYEVDDKDTTHIRSLGGLRQLPDSQLKFILTQMRNGVSSKLLVERLKERRIVLDKKVNLQRFFRQAARERWRRKYESAAEEADAILLHFPQAYHRMDEALIAALKQESFRLLIQEELEPARVKQFFELFLKEKTSALAQAKHEADRKARLETALDAFAEHLDDATLNGTHTLARIAEGDYLLSVPGILTQESYSEPGCTTLSSSLPGLGVTIEFICFADFAELTIQLAGGGAVLFYDDIEAPATPGDPFVFAGLPSCTALQPFTFGGTATVTPS